MPAYIIGQNASGEDILSFTERVTTGLPTITTDHAFIHEGIAFSVSGTLTIAAGVTRYIRMATPVGKYIHFKPAGVNATTGPTTVWMAEGGTLGNGVALTARNRNRISTQTASMTFAITATLTNAGTAITTAMIPAASTNQSKVGGSVASAEEWVLQRAKTYYMAIRNGHASDAALVGYDLFMYEESGA